MLQNLALGKLMDLKEVNSFTIFTFDSVKERLELSLVYSI